MALNKTLFGGGLFSRGWLSHHAPVVDAGLRGHVKIHDDTSRGHYDLDSGAVVGATGITYYDGPARVQKVARPKRSESEFDTYDYQIVRVLIPHTSRLTLPAGAEWHSNLRVEVTAAEDTQLIGADLFVRSWAGSTEAWQTVLICAFDSRTEANP